MVRIDLTCENGCCQSFSRSADCNFGFKSGIFLIRVFIIYNNTHIQVEYRSHIQIINNFK